MIRGLIESSLIDWDGRISLVLFFDKCNFKCPFCHNWELIYHPENFPVIEWKTIQEILTRKKKWIDGVVLTGGEPLLNMQDITELCREIKNEGFPVKIDTNGAFPQSLSGLIEEKLIDYAAMDIKTALDANYDKAAGIKIDLASIKSSIEILMSGNIEYEFRTTCVPGIVDEKTVHSIGSVIKGARKWALQGYRPENAWVEAFRQPLPTGYQDSIRTMYSIAKQYVDCTIIRGITG